MIFIHHFISCFLYPIDALNVCPFEVYLIDGNVAGNVLLLKNNLNLSPDLPEVSQEKLLSLVAERLIDANSNFEVMYRVS